MNPLKHYFNTEFLTAFMLASTFSNWAGGVTNLFFSLKEKNKSWDLTIIYIPFPYSVLCVKEIEKESVLKLTSK